MPLYEYKCTNCGETCEILQKVNEAPAVTCPTCGKNQLKKQVSATRFQLKGSGWYVTDFKNKEKSTKTETKEGEQSGATESKPEPKIEKEKKKED